VSDNLRAYRDDGPLAQFLAGALRPFVGHALSLGLLAAVLLGVAILTSAESKATLLVGGLAFIVLASVGAAGDVPGRLAWLLPPLLRIGEYAFALALGSRTDSSVLPVVYALLAAVAFHHYEIVYRLRHQRVAPPPWVYALGGGWDGRMLLLALLFALGALKAGVAVLAVWCGTLFVFESIASWVRFTRPLSLPLSTPREQQ
jgi:hypothetical protein